MCACVYPILVLTRKARAIHKVRARTMADTNAMCSSVRILTHPIIVIPAAGDYTDDDQECMVLGDFKDSTHLFESVLVKEVHDSIRALPNINGGQLPVANSVVLMTAGDFEKMRRAKAGGPDENLKKRKQAMDAEVIELRDETAKLRKICHELNTRALVAETELKKRDEKHTAQIKKTWKDRDKAAKAILAVAYADHQTTKAELSACQGELAACQGELAAARNDLQTTKAALSACQDELTAARGDHEACKIENARLDADIVHLVKENARLQCELDRALDSAKKAALGEEVLHLLDAARG